jgi:LacI family transcriptional regulator
MRKKDSLTLKNIADRIGLSETTISRALSGQAAKYRISPETEKAILALADELHFSPNQLARSLRLQKTHTIGLMIPDISNPFFANIARNVEREARKSGYSVILTDTEETESIEIESLRLLRGRKVDGLVICPVGQNFTHLEKLFANEMPMVLIDRYIPDSHIPYVSSDNYGGAYQAVSYLIQNGHRRIACIQGLENTLPNIERVRGYRQAHANATIEVDETLIVGDSFGYQNGYIEMKLMLGHNPRPTAIFAVSNLISLGALHAIDEEALKIPDDISIISFDDQPYSALLATPMTTVAQQNEQIGQLALKMLFNQMELKTVPDQKGILIPTRLIVRKSVKNLLASDKVLSVS